MKTTGEKIRESRTHLGLTQTELADKIGVTLRTITKYEKQGVMPRGVNLQRLAEVLGVSTAYLSNDEIVDPNYGLEEAPYIESARAAYGRKGATDVEQLLTQTRALFAGGDVPEQDKELFFQAVTERILLISSEPARSSPVKTTKSKQEYSECTDFWTTLVVLSGCIIENYFLK